MTIRGQTYQRGRVALVEVVDQVADQLVVGAVLEQAAEGAGEAGRHLHLSQQPEERTHQHQEERAEERLHPVQAVAVDRRPGGVLVGEVGVPLGLEAEVAAEVLHQPRGVEEPGDAKVKGGRRELADALRDPLNLKRPSQKAP